MADNFLLARLTTYAAWAAAVTGAILALIGCAVAALVGSAPSPAQLAGIVIGAAVAFALASRFLIARIPWLGLAAYVARRVVLRRQERRDRRSL